MAPEEYTNDELEKLAERIVEPEARGFFRLLAEELGRLSDGIDVDVGTFTVSFTDSRGFSVTLSPYRELFLASVGDDTACDIRVASADGLMTALDLALQHFLESRGPKNTFLTPAE